MCVCLCAVFFSFLSFLLSVCVLCARVCLLIERWKDGVGLFAGGERFVVLTQRKRKESTLSPPCFSPRSDTTHPHIHQAPAADTRRASFCE